MGGWFVRCSVEWMMIVTMTMMNIYRNFSVYTIINAYGLGMA